MKKEQRTFEKLFDRLEKLEIWRELAIRPSEDSCDEDDKSLLRDEIDDLQALEKRSLGVRTLMNQHLPLYQSSVEQYLVTARSQIPESGLGLFYQPTTLPEDEEPMNIPPRTILCYYYGHIHNFQSVRSAVSDKSYLMLVGGSVLVDPAPCLDIKARYINDPLNEELVNCEYVPDTDNFRSAVTSTKEILPNSELFVSYGEMYWSQQSYSGNTFKG